MSKTKPVQTELEFDKIVLLNSKQFTGVEKDILNILLSNDDKYTINQCKELLKIEGERVIR